MNITDVKTYGAVGDNTTNDTAAIQNAINATLQGGVCQFPPGTYLVSGLVVKPGIELKGIGGATLCPIDKNVTLISYNATTDVVNIGFTMDGLNLYNLTKTGCNGVMLNGSTSDIRFSNIRIRDLNIQGPFINGVYLRYCVNTSLNNLFVSGVINGIVIDNCGDTDAVNVKVQNGIGTGFTILGGPGAFDEGVRLVGCSTNVQNAGLYAVNQDWGMVSGCSFTSAAGGAVIMVNCTSWRFANSELATATATPSTAAVLLNENCMWCAFTGCMISNSTFGLHLGGKHHTVVGNNFVANSNVDLYLNGTLRTTVSGNAFQSVGSAFSIVEYGMANYNAITGNQAAKLLHRIGAQSLLANNVVG